MFTDFSIHFSPVRSSFGIFRYSRVTAMRRKLKKLATKLANGEIEYENVENMFRSWMGSFYKLLSKVQRKNLVQLYEDLFDKTVTVVNKKLWKS